MKEIAIEKICNLPVDYKLTDKFLYTLAKESKFEIIYKEIRVKDISDYLMTHQNLIEEWIQWSENKRTIGYALTLQNGYRISKIDSKGKTKFEKIYLTIVEACSEYILKELNQILDIS